MLTHRSKARDSVRHNIIRFDQVPCLQQPVPSQSLFQDGRYAHLWKTYRPTSDFVLQGDSQKLRNLSEEIDLRQSDIAEAAKENCALEAMMDSDCWRHGSWSKRMMLCRTESRALDRCISIQTKLLNALGYASVIGRDVSEDERVQMHADSLYQQMLQHEKAVAEAKDQGLPVPSFQPIMSRESVARFLGAKMKDDLRSAESAQPTLQDPEILDLLPDDIKEETRKTLKAFKKNVANMTPDEKAVEEAELLSRMRDHGRLIKEYSAFMADQKHEREKRQRDGTETITDRLQRWWGNEK